MTPGHPFDVKERHEHRNRSEAKRTRAFPARFPNGDPGVVLISGTRPVMALPHADAIRLIDNIADVIENDPTD